MTQNQKQSTEAMTHTFSWLDTAVSYRTTAFKEIADKYGVCERTVYRVARTAMRAANYPSAIDAAKQFGVAGFTYTHIMQTRRLIPEIEKTLDSFIDGEKVNT